MLSFLKKKGSSTWVSEALDVATTRIESRILVFNRSDRSVTITTRKIRAIRTLLLSLACVQVRTPELFYIRNKE